MCGCVSVCVCGVCGVCVCVMCVCVYVCDWSVSWMICELHESVIFLMPNIQ